MVRRLNDTYDPVAVERCETLTQLFKDFLSISEASQLLSMEYHCARDKVMRGTVAGVKVGESTFIHKNEIVRVRAQRSARLKNQQAS
jgi:hypothetical protein